MLYPKRKIRLFSLIFSTGLLINNFCAFATSPEKANFFDPPTEDLLYSLPTPEKPYFIKKAKKANSTSPIVKDTLSTQELSIYPYASPYVVSHIAPQSTHVKQEAPSYSKEDIDRLLTKIATRITERIDCDEQEYIMNYTKRLLLHVYKNYNLNEEIILATVIYWDKLNSDFLSTILKREESSYIYALTSLLCMADKFMGNDTYFPTAKFWATMCNTDTAKVIEYEKDLCMYFKFNLFISPEEYQIYKKFMT